MFSLFNAKLDRQVQAVTSTSQEPEYLNGTSQDNEHLGSLSSSVQADATVGDLARQLTLCSVQPPYAGVREEDTLFHPKKESDLDPYSSNFSSKAWARKIVDIASRDANKTLRKAGIAYRNLSVHGFGSDTDFQATVTNVFISGMRMLEDAVRSKKNGKVQILSGLDGLVESGEMLIVLGPPGSGCSTLLKTIAGEMDGLELDENARINYRGITQKQMTTKFRGEAIYSAEQDVHFPQLTVGETLTFAAEARAPRHPPGGLTRKQFAHHMRDVAMAVFGISHTVNIRVGNDFVRGVSGGERKRVSIAEALLSGAPLQSWDNSTRGLDSANAIEFCKTLRLATELGGSAAVVAIYQAPQSAYDIFDKVCVLYAGEQIFFGPTNAAKQFFVDMGFHCPEQSTTPDFLTSLTSPAERRARAGFEKMVPKTPKEFVARWKSSENYAQLQRELDEYESRYRVKGEHYQEFLAARRAQQSNKVRPASPYTISFGAQVKLCLRRGFQRLRADPSLSLTQLFGNFFVGLIVASVFYNMQPTTSTFYSRGSLIFFAILLNALASALEILTLYAQRPIVEKHKRYAFVHASAEAVASMLVDLPYKVTNAICFNMVIYFMANLRREPGPFFFFLLISFTATLTMSMLFRFIASISRTLSQALAPAAILILLLLSYAGFAITTPNMLGWIKWVRYLNPVYYAFESLMINEFHNREFACLTFVPNGPSYSNVEPLQHVCSSIGAVPGSSTVNGDAYLSLAYQYFYHHKWRNFGILIAFMAGLCSIYLIAAELVSGKKSKGEVLVFPRSKLHAVRKETSGRPVDSEAPPASRIAPSESLTASGEGEANDKVAVIETQTSIFHWQDVCYDIKIKGEPRRILDHVDGWVKPGTLTALMGVSGAGKTTLLDVLATRVTMGVITGEMLVDGRPRDVSFARKTGYCQQQDLHLETSTVREALQFSAILRQPCHIPRKEKVEYVEEIIKLLEMDAYADAVVGVPGVGLNVEQRKRLTIGVELVAKPELLLFLDEPTSGLDSQTSWSILNLLDKLRQHGQAILCTIHQPSAILFERFDRLLFLAKGGRTIYFGEVGHQSSILTSYFERNGSAKFPATANPAEFMLEVIGAAPGTHTDIDWHNVWLTSPERAAVRGELARLKSDLPQTSQIPSDKQAHHGGYREFAASFTVQFTEVTKRVWQQYWRTPAYIWSKALLCLGCALLVGFSFFKAENSLSGLQNQVFSVFLVFIIFGSLCQQIMPLFVTQRALYEVRERPSKTYSWKVFMFSNIAVEIPWTTLMALLMFFCWYYPVGFYRNAEPTGAVKERGALFFLFLWQFMLFTSSFAFAAIAGVSTAETAGNIANLLFVLVVIFCGVLATPQQFPGFWTFMYRVSPFTYFVQGFTAVGISGTNVVCAPEEFVTFDPPSGETCESYARAFIDTSGGYLANPNATSACDFCTFSNTNDYLAQYDIHYDQRWRNFGLLWSYFFFNIVAALFFYWLARVPKKFSRKVKKE